MKTLKLNTTTEDSHGIWNYEIEIDRENDICRLESSNGSISNSSLMDSVSPDWGDLTDEELIEDVEEWLSER